MDCHLHDLRVFLRVTTAASLSEAGRALQLTPAAVSAVVKRLESRLGVRLLERHSRACRPTPAGERFAQAAAQALQTLADVQDTLAPRGPVLKGLLRLSAPTDLVHGALGPVLDGFAARHPQVELVVRVTDRVHDLWRDGIDLAVRWGELPDSSLRARRLRLTRRLTVASPDYLARRGTPRVPADLTQHDCLVYDVGGVPDDRWHYYPPGHGPESPESPVSVTVRGPRRADDSLLAKRWALQGLGLLNKSDLDLADELRRGTLVAVLADHPGPTVPLSLVTPHRPSAAVRALAAQIEAFLGEPVPAANPAEAAGGVIGENPRPRKGPARGRAAASSPTTSRAPRRTPNSPPR
jgi:DNA-binding transcriptional LysR family regulator